MRARLEASHVEVSYGRGRFWTGVALVARGATLVTLGTVELGDDQPGQTRVRT